MPPNFPLPTKIMTQILEPVDVIGQFGEDPDVQVVDAHVRSVMQTALGRFVSLIRDPSAFDGIFGVFPYILEAKSIAKRVHEG